MSLTTVQGLDDDEYVELAAMALWLENRQCEVIKVGVGEAIATAFGGKKG